MRRICVLLATLGFVLALCAGCAGTRTQDASSFAPAEEDRLVIFTSHKENIYAPIIEEFEQRTGIWVEVESGGSVTMLNRIAAGDSGCDVMFGGGADSLTACSDCSLRVQQRFRKLSISHRRKTCQFTADLTRSAAFYVKPLAFCMENAVYLYIPNPHAKERNL